MDKLLKEELKIFKENNIDVLVLGCSHFSLIRDQIQKLLPNVLILDSSYAVSGQVRRILGYNNILSKSHNPSYSFYTTGGLKTMRYFEKKLTNKAKLSRISL